MRNAWRTLRSFGRRESRGTDRFVERFPGQALNSGSLRALRVLWSRVGPRWWMVVAVLVLALLGAVAGPWWFGSGAEPQLATAVAAPLLMPVRDVSPDDLVDSFGDPRSGGRIHEAIDVMAPRGTDVLAAAAGTVEKILESRLGGKTVYVRLPTNELHYYAHLHSYARGLGEGQSVQAGDVLGQVGSTGNAESDAPHLHFAVYEAGADGAWWQGEAVNPFPLLGGQ